jgi:hypothetical protein
MDVLQESSSVEAREGKNECQIIKKKSEIVKLENEIAISIIVFRIVQGQPYEGLSKINLMNPD